MTKSEKLAMLKSMLAASIRSALRAGVSRREMREMLEDLARTTGCKRRTGRKLR